MFPDNDLYPEDGTDPIDEVKEGERPVPPQLRKLPKAPPADVVVFFEPTTGEKMRGVDRLNERIRAYLNNRCYALTLRLARPMFDWILHDGYWPVGFDVFDIKDWPDKGTELYRLLSYVNTKWLQLRLKVGEDG